MAILTFPALPSALGSFSPGSNLDDIFRIHSAVSASATEIESLSIVSYYSGGSNLYAFDISITGNFTYGPLSSVTGTVTAITASFEGQQVVSFSGLNADAGRVWATLLSTYDPSPVLLSGDDTITGGTSGEYLRGHGGNDTINGLAGNDRLYGGGGDDVLDGGADSDTIYGDRGQDRLNGGEGDDRLYGGTQKDKLFGGDGDDYLFGQGSNDRLVGGDGRDYLDGDVGNDALLGGAGRDRLLGGAGDDTLRGGARNDVLSGEEGDDSLTGGTGVDTFVFQRFGRAGGSGEDRIEDFEAGEKIVLSYVANNATIVTTQVGDDVTIALLDNLVTVADATLAEVQAAIESRTYGYFI